MKLSRASFHSGIQLRHTVKTSVDSAKDNVSIEKIEGGFLIKVEAPFPDVFIGYGNIIQGQVTKDLEDKE